MKTARYYFVIIPILILAGCRPEPAAPDMPEIQVPDSPADASCTISGIMNIEFTDEMAAHIETTSEEDLIAEMSGYGISSLERMFPDAGEWEARHIEAGLHKWYKVTYDPQTPATKAAADFASIPGAATVEIPMKMRSTAGIPFNDRLAPEQWNLYNYGKVKGFVPGVDIDVLPLWKITGGRSDVIVNVVDAGVDMNHEDLKGVVIPAGSNGSKSFVDGHTGYVITPGKHGTHVAGIIGAISNNGLGTVGIAGGLDGKGGVSILSSQIFIEQEDGSELQGDSAGAIVWGADHGALISNNSWCYSYKTEEAAKAGQPSKAFMQAVDYFIKYAGCDAEGNQSGLMKGGIVIFAAGNDGWQYAHPCDYEPVIAVGAVGPDGLRTGYSNYGNWVDICAPGGEFETFKDYNEAMILGPAASKYYYMAGTSMACPHVSGVAALLISIFGGPGFTCEDLKGMLLDGANYTYGATEGIGPMLDAYGSYLAYKGEEMPPQISTDYSGNYNIKGHEILGVEYKVRSNSKKLDIKVECDKSARCIVNDRDISVTFNDGSGKLTGSHTLKITATAESGLQAVHNVNYTILANHAPKVVSQVPEQVIGMDGKAISVDYGTVFADEDGGTLTYSCAIDNRGVFSDIQDRRSLTLRPVADGAANITLTATDPCGEKCSYSFRAGVFDGSKGPSVTPAAVDGMLKVIVPGITEASVDLYNSTGRKVFSGRQTASILDPFMIDMGACAPGIYRASISYDGETFNRNFVKK